ncbi:MAG: YgeY family selenium metabolism-linked hydrolase [Leptolinea sp.]|nr:YgeY family selenium metabolism-linked hydrolase [Leptolinea sp.]
MKIVNTNEKSINKDLIEFTQHLVRTRSFSGEEGELAKIIERRMKTLGFDDVTTDRWGNVIGQVGNGNKTILFDSHMDTVQVHDEELWDEPPFSGTIKDGFLWGRGSVDMKSGLAASVYAAAVAKNSGWLDGKTVFIVCSTLEEDCDGEALKHALETIEKTPDFGVICEPSSNMISTGHKGKAQIIITSSGISAHGSAPEKGKNAVYEMAEIIQRVEHTNNSLMTQPGRHGTLVLSAISSKSVSLNAVPSECRIYLDRRMVVGETEQTICEEMDKIIAGKEAVWEIDTMHRNTWTGEPIVYRPLHPAWEISSDHELIKAFVGACCDATGFEPVAFDYWDFSTDAVALVSQKIPVIGLGPGEHKLAHMRNEKCSVKQIMEACSLYGRAIQRL